jgi:hypothetical protein
VREGKSRRVSKAETLRLYLLARGEFYSNILPTCAVGYDLSPATRARMLST